MKEGKEKINGWNRTFGMPSDLLCKTYGDFEFLINQEINAEERCIGWLKEKEHVLLINPIIGR